MAAIIHSPLQNLKWLKIRYKYIKQPPEVVFGCFTCLQGLTLQKMHLTRHIACQIRKYMSSLEYFDHRKGSHGTENHCGYLISLVSTETPSVKTVFMQRLS